MRSIRHIWMKYLTRGLEGLLMVVNFRAPHYVAEDTSRVKRRFEAAERVSVFLAIQLEERSQSWAPNGRN